MKRHLQSIIALCALALPLAVRADVPTNIAFQGRVTGLNGAPLFNDPNSAADGRIDLKFQIFDALTAGASQWSRTSNNVPVYNGLFSVILDGLDETVFPLTDKVNRWLQVEVSTNNGVTFTPMSPRKEIVSVPYAIRAGAAQALDGISATELSTFFTSVTNVWINVTNMWVSVSNVQINVSNLWVGLTNHVSNLWVAVTNIQTNLQVNLSNLWCTIGYVVGTNGCEPFKTIQSAIDAATADGYNVGRQVTIEVKPGRYTEDLTMRAGIHLKAEIEDGLFSVVVVGNHTYNYAGAADGDLMISGVAFYSPGVTATNPLFAVLGNGYTSLRFNHCVLQSTDNGPALRLNNTGSKGGRPSNTEMFHCRVRNLQPAFNAAAVDLASGSLLMDEADIYLANAGARSFRARNAGLLVLDNAQIRGWIETANNAYLQLSQSSIDSGDRAGIEHNSATTAVILEVMLITTLPGEVITGTGLFLYSHVGFFYSAYGIYQKLPHNPHALPITGVNAANVGYDANVANGAHAAWETVLGGPGPTRVAAALDDLILAVAAIQANFPFDEVDPQVGVIAANRVPSWDADGVNEAGDLGMLVTGTIFDDRANGRIGIGTDTPDVALDVAGQVRITGGTPAAGEVLTSSDQNGLATWEALTFPDEVDPQVGVIADNRVPSWDADGVNEAGDLGMLVTGTIFDDRANGRIGIGTDTPDVALDVAGQVRITGGTPAAGEVLTSSDADGLATWEALPAFVETDPQVGTMTNNYVSRWNAAITALVTGTIFDNGFVGIGTTNPEAMLHVNSNAILTAGLSLRQSGYDGSVANNKSADITHNGNQLKIRMGGAGGRVPINFSMQDTPALYISPDPNVGIRTTNPSSPLHLSQPDNYRDNGLYIQRAGSDYGAVMYMDPDGGARIGTKSDSGINYDDDYIFLGTGSGNVGIRTPPSSRLHIYQEVLNRDGGLYIQRGGTPYGAVMYMDPDGVARIGTRSDPGSTYDTDHIFLNPDNGNVGIGATPAVNRRLDIYSSGTAFLRLRGNNEVGSAGVLEFYDTSSAHNWQMHMGDTGLDDDLKFLIGTDGSSAEELMRITREGNVGIGTPTPDPRARLDVNGLIRIRGGETVNGYVLTSDQNGLASWRKVSAAGPEIDPRVKIRDNNYVPKWSTANDGLITGTIYDNGNVGIGKDNPLAKLDVNGDAITRGVHYLNYGANWLKAFPSAGDLGMHMPMLALSAWAPAYNEYVTTLVPHYTGLYVADWQNTRPSIHVRNNGDLWVHQYVIEGSDGRTKLDQKQLDYGLAEVMAVNAKQYKHVEWEHDKETGKIIIHPEKARNDIGLVAQELQKIIPEAVDVPDDETRQPWGIAYSKLIPVLIKAIQEQQKQIERLEDKIERLEKKNAK